MAAPRPGSPLTSGLAVLLGLVGLGMGIPAFFRWKVFALERERDALLASAPSTPEVRLQWWFSHGQPRILEALRLSRFSAERPWIVSHVVAPGRAVDPPQVWGVDLSDLDPESVALDGLDVRVLLPAPVLLAREVLVGDNALGVAVLQPPGPQDPRVLLRDRVEHALERLIRALPRDIPGARISVEVGGLVRPRDEGVVAPLSPGS